jgi:hypothetical protein
MQMWRVNMDCLIVAQSHFGDLQTRSRGTAVYCGVMNGQRMSLQACTPQWGLYEGEYACANDVLSRKPCRAPDDEIPGPGTGLTGFMVLPQLTDYESEAGKNEENAGRM